jgi:hypothetical protein
VRCRTVPAAPAAAAKLTFHPDSIVCSSGTAVGYLAQAVSLADHKGSLRLRNDVRFRKEPSPKRGPAEGCKRRHFQPSPNPRCLPANKRCRRLVEGLLACVGRCRTAAAASAARMWSGHYFPLACSIGKFSGQECPLHTRVPKPGIPGQMPKAQRGFSFGLGLQ